MGPANEVGDMGPTISGIYPCSKGELATKRKPGKESGNQKHRKFGNENACGDRAGKKARTEATTNCSPFSENNANLPAPTDFRTAFAAHRSDLFGDENRRDARRNAITTLEDITAAPALSPSECIDRSTQLRAVMKAKPSMGPPPPVAARQASLAAPVRQEGRLLEGLEAPPFDWCLKSFARFSSVSPFHMCSGQRTYTAGCSSSSASTSSESDLGVRQTSKGEWEAALLTWQCPEAALEPAAVKVLSGSDARDFMGERRTAWQASFSSLYYCLRRGGCKCFYLVSAKGSRNPFVAFFGAPGVAGRRRLHALVSRSTRGMRALLRAEQQGMEFAMPLAPAGAEAAVEPRIQKELDELGQAAGSDSGSGTDGKPGSLLAFCGPQQVHAIYNWLLDSAMGQAAEALDVPVLLAPVPFLGASRQRLVPQTQPLAGVASHGAKERMFRLEVKGFIPPWTFQRLCLALQNGQEGGFQAYTETELAANNLNLASESGALSRCEGVGTTWDEPVTALAGLTIKELRCQGRTSVDARLVPVL